VRIAVCWKWVSLDGEADPDSRWAGVSDADEAALEVALRIAEGTPTGERHVSVHCLGPAAADEVLRGALAVGADVVCRVDASPRLDSGVVATALARSITSVGVDLVVCGDVSVDRGTGATPAHLAAELGVAQALGLVEVATTFAADGTLRALRRLDGGRREVLDVPVPAVISVEGAVARLRRAPMAASLAARTRTIDVHPGPHGHPPDAEAHPYRPRPRTLVAPDGDALHRVRQLLDIGGSGDHHAELVELDPPAAAERIVAQLREWGHLD
jgi:electron transfer flavoprotein beta subunit